MKQGRRLVDVRSALKPYLQAVGELLSEAAVDQKGTTPKKRKDAILAQEGKWWLFRGEILYLEQRFFSEGRIKDGRDVRRIVLKSRDLKPRLTLMRPRYQFMDSVYGRTLFLNAALVKEKHLAVARKIIRKHGTHGRNHWQSPTKKITPEALEDDLMFWYQHKSERKTLQEIWGGLASNKADRLQISNIRDRIKRVDLFLSALRQIGSYWDAAAPQTGEDDFINWFHDGLNRFQQAKAPPKT